MFVEPIFFKQIDRVKYPYSNDIFFVAGVFHGGQTQDDNQFLVEDLILETKGQSVQERCLKEMAFCFREQLGNNDNALSLASTARILVATAKHLDFTCFMVFLSPCFKRNKMPLIHNIAPHCDMPEFCDLFNITPNAYNFSDHPDLEDSVFISCYYSTSDFIKEINDFAVEGHVIILNNPEPTVREGNSYPVPERPTSSCCIL